MFRIFHRFERCRAKVSAASPSGLVERYGGVPVYAEESNITLHRSRRRRDPMVEQGEDETSCHGGCRCAKELLL